MLRSFGGANVNPTPPEFRYRLRLVLLGSRIRPPSGSNVEFDRDSISFMSSELIKNNNLKAVSSKRKNGSTQLAVVTEISDPENESCLTKESPITEQFSFSDTFTPKDESLRHLAGYLAWKLKKQGKGVYGTPTAKSELKGSCDSCWIQLLSRGGLLIPNEIMAASVLACENEFGNSFDYVKTGTKSII